MERAAIPPAMFVANPDGNILSWSRECEELTGYVPADALQLNMGRLLRAQLDNMSVAGARPCDNWCGQYALERKDGADLAVDLRTTRCGSTGGEVLVCSMQALEQKGGAAELTLATIVEGLPCLFYVIDTEGRLMLWNARLTEAAELDDEDMAQVEVVSFFAPEERDAIAGYLRATLDFGHSMHESTIVGRRGRRTPYLFQCARMQIHGQPCIFGTGLDISERLEAETRLKVTERAMDACNNAIVITRHGENSNLIEYVNPAFTRITGYSLQEALGRDPGFMRAGTLDEAERARVAEAIAQHRSVRAVMRNARKNGDIFWNNLRIDPVFGSEGEVTHYVGVIDDITEARKYEDELRHLATHDMMTGLANRSALHDRLHGAIDRAARDGSCVAVVYLDLDNFKSINDTFGHAAGDQVLKSISGRLTRSVRAGDTVARIGGDEFVAVISQCQGPDHVANWSSAFTGA